jgi:CheY-like chemotaxis protein
VFTEKRDEIDLVILDMTMPGLSGGKTFDCLREIDPTVRVLLASGYNLEGRVQEILDRGCNGFLQKPFHLHILSSKLREMLAAAAE